MPFSFSQVSLLSMAVTSSIVGGAAHQAFPVLHSTDSYEQLTTARTLAERLQAFVILKGHHSALCLPDGHIMFNSTGNAGMATAGSGDVLTGIITGLLARGYKHEDACVVGMYLHGLAGDIAARELGVESVIASDLIQYIPQAFKRLNE